MPTRLAEIVLDAGLASRREVMAAVSQAEAQSVPLVVELVRRTGIDELALVAAIKRRVRVAISDPASVKPDPEALRELSRDVCRRLRVLPLSIAVFDAEAKLLHVATPDPTDAVTLAEVEHITGCRLEPTLMPLSAVEELVDASYRSMVTEVMPRDRSPEAGATAEMPRVEPPSEPMPASGASTVPYHRLSDEASLELRHRALLAVLVKNELITNEDYEAAIRELLKGRDDNP